MIEFTQDLVQEISKEYKKTGYHPFVPNSDLYKPEESYYKKLLKKYPKPDDFKTPEIKDQIDFTLPGYNYLGPGNKIDKGPAYNSIDEDALEHDIAYDKAKTVKEVSDADDKFLSKAGDHFIDGINLKGSIVDTIGAAVGLAGIGAKKAVESNTGILYPSVSGMPYRINPAYLDDYNRRSKKEQSIIDRDYRDTYYEHYEEPSVPDIQADSPITDTVADNPANAEPVDANTSNKRPADSNEAEANKRPKNTRLSLASNHRDNTVSSSGLGVNQGLVTDAPDIEMGLPGTGREMADGGASGSSGMAVHRIERPLSIFGKKISVYTKSHKFMTFGLASAVLTAGTPPSLPVTGSASALLTTHLAEIPWQKLPLYLNESEFNLLPDGSRAVKAHVKVTFRGNRIAFQTNSTATSLATLNQISNVSTGVGLNKTGWVFNRSFSSFDSDQPMIPTQTTDPVYIYGGNYRGMLSDYYGVPNNNSQFGNNGFYPHHQVGTPCFLYNYLCMASQIHATGNPANPTPYGNPGWPCLAEKISQYDGKTIVNIPIIDETYNFKLAPIKQPLISNPIGFPYTTNVLPTNGQRSNVFRTTVQVPALLANQNTSGAGTSDSAISTNRDWDNLFLITSDIEKSQILRVGPWGEADGQVQPSIHVGVQPVPSLTTTQLLADRQFNSWVDSMGYFDVVATLYVEEHQPTAFPWGFNANVSAGENMFTVAPSERPNPDNTLYAGLKVTGDSMGTIPPAS